jgi:hypothetical protein
MIFVLDTNVLWKHGRIARLATLARRNGHRVVVPALAHAERIAQLRREHGADFDPEAIREFLTTHKIAILPFGRLTAERAAEALATRYSSPDHWHAARRERCAGRFQVVLDQGGQTCPGTVDWYLAAPYSPPDYVVVTLDGGAEFAGMDVVSLDEALALAEGGGAWLSSRS